jgi:pimeloyl-ACP methyl ester carboxylesterase
MRPIPIPAQVQAKDGVAQIPDTRLWYWDTGGQGVPIVLLHPATGSALIWGYQQPVLAIFATRLLQLRALRPEQSWHWLRGP